MERKAMMLRNNAALSLVKGGVLKPWEALLYVVAPTAEVHEASIQKAKE